MHCCLLTIGADLGPLVLLTAALHIVAAQVVRLRCAYVGHPAKDALQHCPALQ